MATNGYSAPMAGHIGRIPNYGKTQVNPMGHVEPPACIQNAMMTKDKKPFTYTPGGLDLSQIRKPSMARRMARQKSLEDHEQAQQQINNGGNNYRPQGGPGGPGGPPPPPPMNMPAPPPPPPPIVIQVPGAKSPKPALGERPEIVIPENPIGMLRKTHSPYHWESEQAELAKIGPVPKYQEKVPSPLTVKMPPSNFSQQQPQTYTPQAQNNFQRHPESPIHRPEAQYMHQNSTSPLASGSPPTRELLQRQDSQFNKSPQPFGGQSPHSNSSTPYSPTPNNNWRQPEKRDSPVVSSPQQSPMVNRSPFSPNTQQYSPNFQGQNQIPATNSGPAFHTLPRASQRNQDNTQNSDNVVYNNVSQPKAQSPAEVAPWRTNTLNRYHKEPQTQQTNANNNQQYVPQWKANETSNNNENSYIPPWHAKQENKQQLYQPPWVQDANNNKVQESNNAPRRSQNENIAPSSPSRNQAPEQPRYQSTMSIPVTPRKPNSQPTYNQNQNYNNASVSPPQKEVVYVNEEPVYYCPGPGSPKSIPPWVKTQKEKTKTPPPEWVQRPLQGRQSAPRELYTPPRDTEPEWVKKSNGVQRGARDVVSPSKNQQGMQPSWSTLPSENRKSLPKDNVPSAPGRVIPIKMEVSSTDTRDNGRHGNQQPQLRITIGMNQPADQARAPFSPPTQRIMRVLSPQLVRMDEPQHELPTLNRSFPSQDNQPKTRIIPIQIEGSNGGANKSVYYHKFTQEGPPRQSKAFKVLQIITDTQDSDNMQSIENKHGFTDL